MRLCVHFTMYHQTDDLCILAKAMVQPCPWYTHTDWHNLLIHKQIGVSYRCWWEPGCPWRLLPELGQRSAVATWCYKQQREAEASVDLLQGSDKHLHLHWRKLGGICFGLGEKYTEIWRTNRRKRLVGCYAICWGIINIWWFCSSCKDHRRPFSAPIVS